LSDTELICNLPAQSLPDGSYQVALIDNIQGGTDRSTVAASTSAFTSAPF
jgi:hypothetical protein